MNPLPPAVVLGGDVTALSVARSLAAAGVVVDVLDVAGSPARFSRSVRRFIDVGGAQPQRAMLDHLRRERSGAVLLPGSDEGVELVACHRAELEDLGHRPVEGDDEALSRMLDKAETYELARRHGIAAPRVFTLRNDDEVEQAISQIEFPCVTKPVLSHLFARKTGSGSKIELIETPTELRERVRALREKGVEMLVTEVIVGASDEFVSYYGYLDEDGRSLLTFTKRKIRQQPPGFGIGTYHETTLDPEVAATGLEFLLAAGVRGLGNVEFKRDSSDGELKLIECNLRFTMSNELIRAAGLDLALFCYCRAAGLEPPLLDSYRGGHDAVGSAQGRARVPVLPTLGRAHDGRLAGQRRSSPDVSDLPAHRSAAGVSPGGNDDPRGEQPGRRPADVHRPGGRWTPERRQTGEPARRPRFQID